MSNIDQNNPAAKGRLAADPEQLRSFAEALLLHAGTDGYISLRSFREEGGKSFRISAVPLKRGLERVINEAITDAGVAANAKVPVVFCPPLAVLASSAQAREQDLSRGLVLTVECDQHAGAARKRLEALLGPATIVVESGGEWIDPESGEVEPKLHLHWRLNHAAEGDALADLKQARDLACTLVGADVSNKSIVHPIRWPGSWHRKAGPKLCRIVAIKKEREISLAAALKILNGKGNGKADAFESYAEEIRTQGPEQRAEVWGELFSNILGGEDYHDSLNRLAMKLLLGGTDDRVTANILRAFMQQTPIRARDERWKARYADIDRAVSTARGKIDANKGPEEQIQPLDLWGNFPAPELPRGLLPKVIEDFALVEGEIMGADPAGLAMGALAVCGAAISDEIKLQVKLHSRGWTEEARLWVGLLGGPSEKKSPILREVDRALKAIDHRLMGQFLASKAAYEALPKEQKEKRKEPRRERLRIEDTTIEACQDAQRYNPRGMLAVQDEISGWFGGMDKYGHGGKGAGKDRGYWLQSWNGGSYGVDRVNRGMFEIPNIGLSVLGGVQVSVIRKLASEVYDDGLIQRLLPIVLRRAEAGKDEPTAAVADDYAELIEQLYRLTPKAVDVDPFAAAAGNFTIGFDEAAQQIRQQTEQKHRELTQQMEEINKRLASHVGKYDGYFARLCLIWHCIEHAGSVRLPALSLPGVPESAGVKLPGVIGADIAERVATFMHEFLFRHAIAFYQGVLGLADDHDRLAAIAGYILAHGVEEVSSRDVAQSLHDMRGLSRRETEALFEQLEAFGWLFRTPGPRPSSPPRWKVNPAVHRMFAQRAKEEAERRKQAKKLIAAEVAHIHATGKKSTARGRR